jgi:hypothetical protein
MYVGQVHLLTYARSYHVRISKSRTNKEIEKGGKGKNKLFLGALKRGSIIWKINTSTCLVE